MPVLRLAKKFSLENAGGVWGITDGDNRRLHYLLSCYKEYDFLQSVGHPNPSPDLVNVSLVSNIYLDDLEFMGLYIKDLISYSKEPEIQNLMAKMYWCLLNSRVDAIWALLNDFYESVESA